jgi:hypothetical protein
MNNKGFWANIAEVLIDAVGTSAADREADRLAAMIARHPVKPVTPIEAFEVACELEDSLRESYAARQVSADELERAVKRLRNSEQVRAMFLHFDRAANFDGTKCLRCQGAKRFVGSDYCFDCKTALHA